MGILFLVKSTLEEEIFNYYIKDTLLEDMGLEISVSHLPRKSKIPASEILDYLEDLYENLDDIPKYIFVADSAFMKAITKFPGNASDTIGYIKYSNDISSSIVYIPSVYLMKKDPYKGLNHLERAYSSFERHLNGQYKDPGTDIIHSSKWLYSPLDIEMALQELLEHKILSCDIETRSLQFYEAGILTIAFSWDEHNGIAFPVDFLDIGSNKEVKAILRRFFEAYSNKGTLLFHNAGYDVTVLIYELFMKGIGDTEGLLDGLEVFKNVEDTKIIAYLSTNSCAGNELGLKALSAEYTGNYGLSSEEITNLENIPLSDVLEYNLIDTLATFYVYNKHRPMMIKDNQLGVYNQIFRPALIDIIQMQLTGLPLNIEKVKSLSDFLNKSMLDTVGFVKGTHFVQETLHLLGQEWAEKKNATYKVKRVTYEDYNEEFNLASGNHVAKLVYEVMGLPIIEVTKTGLPSTGKDILNNLINHTNDELVKDVLRNIIEYKDVAKLASSFIPRMLNSPKGLDGNHYLFGNFNLGGTVSGRLSSSNVNLQNLPSSKSKYSKVFKECFSAPKGTVFCGLDFDSLENKISGLTSKDQNKLQVYTDGICAHCLNAFNYFKAEMPDIEKELQNIEGLDEVYKVTKENGEINYLSKEECFKLGFLSEEDSL